MRSLGQGVGGIMMVLAAIGGFLAFQLPITADGSLARGSVVNIHLLLERQTYLQLAALLFVAGVVAYGLATVVEELRGVRDRLGGSPPESKPADAVSRADAWAFRQSQEPLFSNDQRDFR